VNIDLNHANYPSEKRQSPRDSTGQQIQINPASCVIDIPVVASQCQTLPASAGHSHSIVNELFFRFNINGLIVGVCGNTMKKYHVQKFLEMASFSP